jgi:hypothetical protein
MPFLARGEIKVQNSNSLNKHFWGVKSVLRIAEGNVKTKSAELNDIGRGMGFWPPGIFKKTFSSF